MSEVVSKNNTEHYKWGEVCDGWHLLKRDDLSIIQESVPPGRAEVRHYHNISKQFFYVIKGTATMEAGGVYYTLNKNEGIFIQAGTTHQLMNDGAETLEFIVVSSPKSHGDRVEA